MLTFEGFMKSLVRDFFYDEYIRSVYEATYAYRVDDITGLAYNVTLFQYVGGVHPDDFSFDMYLVVKEKIHHLLLSLRDKKQELVCYDDVRCSIIDKALDYYILMLELVYLGLPFEAEKAGVCTGLSDSERTEIVQKQQMIDRKLFGSWVSENPLEVSYCYTYLCGIYDKGKNVLSVDEQKLFESYLDCIVSLDVYDAGIRTFVDNDLRTDDIFAQTLASITLTRDQYVRLFALAFQCYGIEKPVVVEERSSIYDGPEALAIPSADSYAFKDAYDVLSLIAHEVGTHYITDANHPLGRIRGGRYLSSEEGLAMVSELLFAGVSLDCISGYSESHILILMGELLQHHDDYLSFYGLYSRLCGSSRDVFLEFLRKTRNMGAGVLHKDTVYARGQKMVADYIMDGGDIDMLYAARLDIDDTIFLADHGMLDMSVVPFVLSDAVAYVVCTGSIQGIDEFLHNKYPFFPSHMTSYSDLTNTQKEVISSMAHLIQSSA